MSSLTKTVKVHAHGGQTDKKVKNVRHLRQSSDTSVFTPEHRLKHKYINKQKLGNESISWNNDSENNTNISSSKADTNNNDDNKLSINNSDTKHDIVMLKKKQNSGNTHESSMISDLTTLSQIQNKYKNNRINVNKLDTVEASPNPPKVINKTDADGSDAFHDDIGDLGLENIDDDTDVENNENLNNKSSTNSNGTKKVTDNNILSPTEQMDLGGNVGQSINLFDDATQYSTSDTEERNAWNEVKMSSNADNVINTGKPTILKKQKIQKPKLENGAKYYSYNGYNVAPTPVFDDVWGNVPKNFDKTFNEDYTDDDFGFPDTFPDTSNINKNVGYNSDNNVVRRNSIKSNSSNNNKIMNELNIDRPTFENVLSGPDPVHYTQKKINRERKNVDKYVKSKKNKKTKNIPHIKTETFTNGITLSESELITQNNNDKTINSSKGITFHDDVDLTKERVVSRQRGNKKKKRKGSLTSKYAKKIIIRNEINRIKQIKTYNNNQNTN
mmetsp:Transcript_71482/g.87683  ORF Transcript_71482/g.87683 Transcript_71482/m.87683 type:complete len:500 (+) Transcript_71482:356-1855(+)